MNRVFTIPLAASLIYSARALPVRGGVEPAWVAEPRGRGTIGLVLPCVITLALCVWAAIHLNVISRPTPARVFAFKLVWVLMGIFTPELVLWCSFSQYLEARKVRELILDIRSKRQGLPLPPTMRQKCWSFVTQPIRTQAPTITVDDFSMKAAFFVIMGGYALDFAPENIKVPPKAITARSFVELYGDGKIKDNDLDIKPIEDKAKADGLAKLVVCMQALWLVVQGIGRLLSGLPLPLLELHIIMHVLCAVIMYVFWWHKPMDVRHPIDLGEKIDGFREALRRDPHPALQNPEPSSINGNDDTPKPSIPTKISDGHSKEQTKEAARKSETAERVPVVNSTPISHDQSETTSDSVTHDNGFLTRCSEYWERYKVENKIVLILASYETWHETFRPWLLPPNELESTKSRIIRCRNIMNLSQNYVVDRARMIRPKYNLRGDFISWTTFNTLAGLSLLYGGAHVAAWNTHFPTTVENLLWKISASVATSFVPFSLLAFHSQNKLDEYLPGRDYAWARAAHTLNEFAFVVYFCLATVIFVTSRLFLTVESFLSLRSLPEGSFETVPWSNYWPHF